MKQLKQLRKQVTNKGLTLMLKNEMDCLHYGVMEVANSRQKSETIFKAMNFRLKLEKVKELTWAEFLDVMYMADVIFK